MLQRRLREKDLGIFHEHVIPRDPVIVKPEESVVVRVHAQLGSNFANLKGKKE